LVGYQIHTRYIPDTYQTDKRIPLLHSFQFFNVYCSFAFDTIYAFIAVAT